MELDVDFYSNDLQKDVTVSAVVDSEGDFSVEGMYCYIEYDPKFTVNDIRDYEDNVETLSGEEISRVEEILCNVYWSQRGL
jgi:hypothetical protein